MGGEFLDRELPNKEPETLGEMAARELEAGDQTSASHQHPGPFGGNVEQETGDSSKGIDSAEVQAEGPILGLGGIFPKEKH